MKLVAAIASAALLLTTVGCASKERNESVKAANEAAKAYGQSQWETAIERFQKAVEKWRDNYTAWYGLAGAYSKKGDWKSAADAAQNAVQLAPEIPMHQLVYGVALYERARQVAREAEAVKMQKKPDEVTPDLSTVSFEKPLQHLQEAVKLNPDLWRAHYYLGRIYRDTGKVKEAAEELTKALQSAPPISAPWVALADLYLSWDYTDQALAVALQGTAASILPDASEAGDVWYQVGRAYDDKALHDKAIEAYSKALELRRELNIAKFQRGQAYFKKGDYTSAKRDLEEFSKVGGASVDFSKQQAAKMLMDIAAKSASTPAEKLSPEEVVKRGKRG
jgi:tetratricopeptide (TPR) repeat protein